MSEPTTAAAAAGRDRPRPRRPGAATRSTSPSSRSVELRVAQVKAAEKIAGSKKLLKLQVDLGDESAAGRGRHRRRLRAGGAGRPEGRAGREPEAGEADGRGVATAWCWPPPWTARPCCARSTPTCRRARRSSSGARAACARALGSAAGRLGCPRRCGCPRAAEAGRLRPGAARSPVAERWSAREVLLFGTPAAEPHQAEGFYREARPAGGDGFVWSKGEAELSLTWPRRAPRGRGRRPRAVPRRARARRPRSGSTARPSAGSRSTTPATATAFALPAAAQRAGDNRLRFVFAATASPADAARERRPPAAGGRVLHAWSSGGADDAGARGPARAATRPRPFAVTAQGGVPALRAGRAERRALRAAAARGRRAALHARAAPGARARRGASASFRVTLERAPGEERELWSPRRRPRDRARRTRCACALPGAAGDIVRLGLHVGGAAPARASPGACGRRRACWAAARRRLARGRAAVRAEDAARAEALRAGAARRERRCSSSSTPRAPQHFGAYGYARATTPEIDRIAAEGVVFERAYTPAVYTLGAMSSVWTSQYPDRHHARGLVRRRGCPKDRLTLAELLSAPRRAHRRLRGQRRWPGAPYGFDRGFAEFHEVLARSGRQPGRGLPPRAARLAAPRSAAGASSPTSTSASRTSPTTRRRRSTPASAPTGRSPRRAQRRDDDLVSRT